MTPTTVPTSDNQFDQLKRAVAGLTESQARELSKACDDRASECRSDTEERAIREAIAILEAAKVDPKKAQERLARVNRQRKPSGAAAAKGNGYPFKAGHRYGLKSRPGFEWTSGSHGGKRPPAFSEASPDDIVDHGLATSPPPPPNTGSIVSKGIGQVRAS